MCSITTGIFHHIAQTNTALHDVYCIYPHTYDPGISQGSINQCILGDVYLGSTQSKQLVRKYLPSHGTATMLCSFGHDQKCFGLSIMNQH